MHDGGTSELGTRLRHLLAWLGLLLVGSTLGSFVVAFVQYGSAYWSGPHGLDAVLRWSGMGLLAIACGLLAVGCAGLLGEPEWPRPVLFGGSVVWLAAAIVVLYLFAGQVLRTMPPLRSTSWAIFAREAENWLIASSALPLLLLVFVWWPEVISAPQIAGRPTGLDLPFPPSSLRTRLMRVISVYAVVFGAGTLLVVIWLTVAGETNLPRLRLPHSIQEAFRQAGTVFEWISPGLLIVGAVAEMLRRRWGRQFMLFGAVTWIAGALSYAGWLVVLDLTSSRTVGRLLTARSSFYPTLVLGAVGRNMFPLMLLICLRWRELREAATTSDRSAGFQPIMTPPPIER